MMMAQHYTVQPGNTLSQIAASYGVSWQSVWVASDPPVKDPNLIYAGEVLTIPGSQATSQPYQPSPAPQPSPSPSDVSGGLSGVSGGSFQSCVISRESGGNPRAVNPSSGAGGLYQFLPSTWASLGYSGLPENASVSEQTQAFNQLYAEDGTSPWAPSDHCS